MCSALGCHSDVLLIFLWSHWMLGSTYSVACTESNLAWESPSSTEIPWLYEFASLVKAAHVGWQCCSWVICMGPGPQLPSCLTLSFVEYRSASKDGHRGQQGRLGGGTGGVHGQPRSMYPMKRKQLLLSHSLWLPFGNVLWVLLDSPLGLDKVWESQKIFRSNVLIFT